MLPRRAVVAPAVVIAAAALALAAGRDWAQTSNQLDVEFHGFQDTRSVTVLSPTFDLTKDFTERSTLRVSFGVDAISAASDSCARCHREGASNRREVGSLSVTRKYGDTKLSLGGSYSQENFYRASTFLTSVSRDLANANTTIAGGYSFSLNQPMLHPTRTYENQFANDGFVSLTQTLSRTTIGQIGYEIAQINGYQDNPFLRTDVNGVMVLGHVPDARTRQTLSARLRQSLPAQTVVQIDYRHYFDTWQLTSNDITVGVMHHFAPQLEAGFSYRKYDQTGTYFYAPAYFGPTPEFFTADFRLEPFASGLYTGNVVITPKGAIWKLPDGTGLLLQYERYRADNGFEAAIFSAGFRIPLPTR